MPSFYDYAPDEIAALAFNSRRSQLYPANPPTAGQAIEDSLANRRADAIFSAKMGYSRFKTGPAAMAYGENVQGVLDAYDAPDNFVTGIVEPLQQGRGVYTPRMASADFVSLPQANDTLWMNPNPAARNMPDRPTVQSYALDAYAQQASNPQWAGEELTARTMLSTAYLNQQTPLGRVLPAVAQPRSKMLRRALRGVGGLGEAVDDSKSVLGTLTPAQRTAYALLGTAGMGIGLYHGWKRTGSTGWTIGWGLLGAWLPILVIPLAFIQGIGKKEGR